MDMTKEEVRIWRAGVKHGLTMFAWWKDGVEYLGTCGTTLKEVLLQVDYGHFDAEADVRESNTGSEASE